VIGEENRAALVARSHVSTRSKIEEKMEGFLKDFCFKIPLGRNFEFNFPSNFPSEGKFEENLTT
jgi:hypothetical protein